MISIITVTFNSEHEIKNFVESINIQGVETELWVVDNASKDNTVKVVQNLAEIYPWVKLIANKENIGLAAANNLPIKLLAGRFTAVINPDVILHENTLSILKNFLEMHDDVVAVAPVNLYDNGKPHTSFHRKWTLIHLFVWKLFPGKFVHAIYRMIRRYDEQNVLFASGSCIMTRTELFQAIAGYDPEYFLAVEDVCDLCIRLREGDNSKRVVLTPSAKITHLVSRSSNGVPLILLWNSAYGSIYHFHKHGGFIAGKIAFIIQFASSLIRLLSSFVVSFFKPTYLHNVKNHLNVINRLVKIKKFK